MSADGIDLTPAAIDSLDAAMRANRRVIVKASPQQRQTACKERCRIPMRLREYLDNPATPSREVAYIRTEFPEVIDARFSWIEDLLRPPMRPRRIRRSWVYLISISGYLLAQLVGLNWYTGFVILLAVIVPWVLWLQVSTRERAVRTAKKIQYGICADCGYSIAQSREQARSTAIDFARCPECGVSWPLIPPSWDAPDQVRDLCDQNSGADSRPERTELM